MVLEELSPRFVLPVGSQVVMTRELGAVGGGPRFKNAGTVGRVVEAPLTNASTYLVELSDCTPRRGG